MQPGGQVELLVGHGLYSCPESLKGESMKDSNIVQRSDAILEKTTRRKIARPPDLNTIRGDYYAAKANCTSSPVEKDYFSARSKFFFAQAKR